MFEVERDLGTATDTVCMICREMLQINILQSDLARPIFDWKVASWHRLFAEVLSTLEGDFAGKTVLEVGANKGGLSLFFSLLGCKVVCSEVTPRQLKNASRLHSSFGCRCSYLGADLRSLPIHSESVDIVIMKSVLGGIYSYAGRRMAVESLNEVYRVLRKGGYCILLEQLVGDPLTRFTRWLRGQNSSSGNWHYFRSEEFFKTDMSLLPQEFRTISIKCLSLSSYMFEHLLSSNTLVVRLSLILDRLVEPLIHDDWKHLIGVVAIK